MKYKWDFTMIGHFGLMFSNLFKSIFICLNNNNRIIEGPIGNIEIESDCRHKEFYTITVKYLGYIVLQFWVQDNVLQLVKFWNGHWANYFIRSIKDN